MDLFDKDCSQFSFSNSCTLYMAFCHGLNITGCNTSSGPVSLCITNTTIGYSIGRYDSGVNPFKLGELYVYT